MVVSFGMISCPCWPFEDQVKGLTYGGATKYDDNNWRNVP